MSESEYRIQVTGENDAETARLTAELREALLNEMPQVPLRTAQADPEDQSDESLLLITLAVAAHGLGAAYYSINLVEKAIKHFKQTHPGAKVTVHDAQSRLVAIEGDDH